MKTTCVIARRRYDWGVLEYGPCGMACDELARTLMDWYTGDEMTEYLFSLGVCRSIGKPLTETFEDAGCTETEPLGLSYRVTDTERAMLPRHYHRVPVFLYDCGQWHYIHPGIFWVRMPLWLAARDLGSRGLSPDWRSMLERALAEEMLIGHKDDGKSSGNVTAALASFNGGGGSTDEADGRLAGRIIKRILEANLPLSTLADECSFILDCFDELAVAVPDGDMNGIKRIEVRKAGPGRRESDEWIWWLEDKRHPELRLGAYRPYTNPYITERCDREAYEALKACSWEGPDGEGSPLQYVPSWFIPDYRQVKDNEAGALRMIRQSRDRLIDEHKGFAAMYEGIRKREEEAFHKMIKEEDAQWLRQEGTQDVQ